MGKPTVKNLSNTSEATTVPVTHWQVLQREMENVSRSFKNKRVRAVSSDEHLLDLMMP
jgi:hypothetical protein